VRKAQMQLPRWNSNYINSKKIHLLSFVTTSCLCVSRFHTMRKFVTIFSLFKSRKSFSVSLHRNSPRCSNQLHPNFRNLTKNCHLLLSPLSSHRFFSTTMGNPLQDQVLLPSCFFTFSTFIGFFYALLDSISLFGEYLIVFMEDKKTKQ